MARCRTGRRIILPLVIIVVICLLLVIVVVVFYFFFVFNVRLGVLEFVPIAIHVGICIVVNVYIIDLIRLSIGFCVIVVVVLALCIFITIDVCVTVAVRIIQCSVVAILFLFRDVGIHLCIVYFNITIGIRVRVLHRSIGVAVSCLACVG